MIACTTRVGARFLLLNENTSWDETTKMPERIRMIQIYLDAQRLLLLLCLSFGLTSTGNAVLIDRGGGLIYDTVLDITWLQDANYAQTSGFDADGRMTWFEARDWANNLTYFDSVRNVTWTDWRLPYATV